MSRETVNVPVFIGFRTKFDFGAEVYAENTIE